MKNSEILSNKPAGLSNAFLFIFGLIPAIGFSDATYLTAKHFLGEPVTCSILKGCEQVTSSPYSLFLGLPVALFGSAFYLAVLLLVAIYFQYRNQWILKIITALSFLAVAASAHFVYLQLFVIKAICIFCMASAITSTTIFILSLVSLRKNKTPDNTPLAQ